MALSRGRGNYCSHALKQNAGKVYLHVKIAQHCLAGKPGDLSNKRFVSSGITIVSNVSSTVYEKIPGLRLQTRCAEVFCAKLMCFVNSTTLRCPSYLKQKTLRKSM